MGRNVTKPLDQLRRCSVAVDLGSARTRVHIKQAGLVVDEPSAVAVNTSSGALIAVGTPPSVWTAAHPATSVSYARCATAP